MKLCHACGTPWEAEKRQPGVKEYCEKCSAYLHCCLNCRFYNPAVHNHCEIPNTEWVGDKAGANFCDEFEFRDTDVQSKTDVSRMEARQLFDQLFRDK